MGKPVVTPPPILTTPTLVIVNQDSTNILHPSQYKTVPVCCQCPNCNKMITTFVVKKSIVVLYVYVQLLGFYGMSLFNVSEAKTCVVMMRVILVLIVMLLLVVTPPVKIWLILLILFDPIFIKFLLILINCNFYMNSKRRFY